MYITRECDYAVRVIRALEGEKRLSVGEICKSEELTSPFAYKILKKLQAAQIVKGFRGVHGGYALERPTSQITLLDVYQAIDPDMYLVDCMDPGKPCSRNGAGGKPCQVHRKLASIQKKLWDLLSEESLENILNHEQ